MSKRLNIKYNAFVSFVYIFHNLDGWNLICKYAELYALILSQRNRNDSSSSDGSSDNNRRGYRAGGTWEYEDNYRQDTSRGTSSSSYPVVPTQPANDEFRPKKESEIKKVWS